MRLHCLPAYALLLFEYFFNQGWHQRWCCFPIPSRLLTATKSSSLCTASMIQVHQLHCLVLAGVASVVAVHSGHHCRHCTPRFMLLLNKANYLTHLTLSCCDTGAIVAANAGFPSLVGIVVCWVGLFGPGILMIFAVLPWWASFRRFHTYRRCHLISLPPPLSA